MARTPLLRALKRQVLIQTHQAPRPDHSPAANPDLISRRDFVTGLGAAAAVVALPKISWAEKKDRQIAIIGGGISGLSCALHLADHGINATLYEASKRLGGRMFSNVGYWNDAQVSEWCGELIDTKHKTIQHLAKRFGLVLDNLWAGQPKNSEDTYFFSGAYYTKAQFDADLKPVLTKIQEDLKACDYPTNYQKFTVAGKTLDKMSVFDWIASRVPGGHASPLGQLLDVAYTIEYGANTQEQSSLNLIYMLGYQPEHGDAAVFGESDERFHIRGGNESLPKAIAKHLGKDKMKMGKQLIKLKKEISGEYRLLFRSPEGALEEVVSDTVVLALPFSVLREIDFSQAGFDTLKQKAIRELGRGKSAKTQLQFDQRIWRHSGAWPGISNGSTYTDAGFQSSWEVSRCQKGSAGILNFFSGGKTAERMKTTQPFTSSGNPLARIDAEAALHTADSVFPGLSHQWNQKLTQSIPHLSPLMGASYAYYRVGQYTAFGGYEGVPQGRVFFCGDHTSQEFQGYMEGAASEGLRAAKEVLKS